MAGRPRRLERRRGGAGARVALVASRFHETIARALVAGATRTFREAGVPVGSLRTVWVPGVFELPLAAAWLAASNQVEAIVALGCVIRGETPQYAALGHAAAQGLAQVSVEAKIPVTFGVIIAETISQAKARAGGAFGNRGEEAAMAALELLALRRQMTRRLARQTSVVKKA